MRKLVVWGLLAAYPFIEAFADRFLRLEAKQLARRLVEVSDAARRISHDDAFLDGVEDGLDQALFVRELEKVILHLLRAHASETLDQLSENTGFHGAPK